MNVLFAPDYRAALGYQGYLSRELQALGVGVEFLSHYRRGLPLTRGVREIGCDILHIHWPEVYFSARKPFGWLRKLRYTSDLSLAVGRRRRLFVTAHNLLPHNRHEEWGVFTAVRDTLQLASGVFAHSAFAKQKLIETFDLHPERVWVIPYGDHTDGWRPPIGRIQARERLNLPHSEKICLIFGTVSRYKGTDELIRHWVNLITDAKLLVIGPVLDNCFATELQKLARQSPQVELRISPNWLSDEDLHLWLSAVDCSVFNYREIFTSGAAAQARSMGVPVLIPERLKAVDLSEPHRLVHRFQSLETDFNSHLRAALAIAPDYSAAEEWRHQTSWREIALKTKTVYEANA